MENGQEEYSYELERRIQERGWEYFGNVNERKAVPYRDIAFIVFEDGRAYRRKGYPSPEATLPRDFGGIPYDFKEQTLSAGVVDDFGTQGFVAGNVEPSSFDDFVSPKEPLGVILGDTDNRYLCAVNQWLTNYPGRTIGSISSSSTGGTGCTGVMVGPRHVLTGAHCLHDGNGTWTWPRYFSPGQLGSNTPNGAPRKGIIAYARTFHIAWDYGLLILEDEPETANLGWMGLGWYSPLSSYSGKWAQNHGYPIASQECAASPLESGNCGGFMYCSSFHIDHATDGYLMYECDATGGHSGSPIWRWWGESPVVLGVHKRSNEPGSGADVTSSPPTLQLGPRVRPEMFNDLCDWIGNHPSAFASHSLCN
jgi:V8-like Glu-specific endopeptidase